MDNTKSITSNKIVDRFSEMSAKSEIAEVLKELFDIEKIDIITDLTPDDIKICTRIQTIADLKDIPVWTNSLKYYMKLSLSKNRKSRREVIEAVRGHTENKGGLLSRINPMNWGN